MTLLAHPQVGKLRTDDPEEEKKQKDFKSMLNKLTPNNQEKLLQKFLAVGITQAKTLRNLIDQARAALLLRWLVVPSPPPLAASGAYN